MLFDLMSFVSIMYSLKRHLSQPVLSGYVSYRQLPHIQTRLLIVMWVQQAIHEGGYVSASWAAELV